MKYTIDDVIAMLESAIPMHEESVGVATIEVFASYIKEIKEQYSLQYDRLNLRVASQAHKYIEALRAETISEQAMAELIGERDNLIDVCESLRARLGLSVFTLEVLQSNRDKYLLEISEIRDNRIALDFDEMRAIGGTSNAEDAALAYPFIDIKAFFEGGYRDRNISQAEWGAYKEETIRLFSLSQSELSTESVKIYLQLEELRRERETIINTIKSFINNWAETRQRILNDKQNVLSKRLIQRQIQNIREVNADMIKSVESMRGDEPEDELKPSDIRPGPRKPGPPRDEDQAEEDFPEDD